MSSMTLTAQQQSVFAGNQYQKSYVIDTPAEYREAWYCKSLRLTKVYVISRPCRTRERGKPPKTVYFIDDCSTEFADLADVADHILRAREPAAKSQDVQKTALCESRTETAECQSAYAISPNYEDAI